MTVGEAIQKLDAIKVNAYSTAQKVQWLNEKEAEIWQNIISTHANPDHLEFEPLTEDNMRRTLFADVPYDMLYVYWLQSRVDMANGEISKYNVSAQLFNAQYAAFDGYWNRTHRPIHKVNAVRL